MNRPPITKERSLQVFKDGSLHPSCDVMVLEENLRIILNDQELVSLACSPDACKELAIGYLLDEGFIKHHSDIKSITWGEGLCIKVQTAMPFHRDIGPGRIHTAMGKSYASGTDSLPVINDKVIFEASHLLGLIRTLNDAALTFKQTGGVHSAALGGSDGFIVRYEDIGRHNAVDKVFGYALLNNIPLHDKCLVLSGRIASEILLKAARNGIPLVLSRSAPTILAVELAEKIGITVVGFARGERFNLYTHNWRVTIK